MSQGPPPEPVPPPGEPLDVKVKRLLAPFLPPTDASQETPETKMVRAIYILIAVALVVFILCGGLALVASVFK